MTVGIEIKPGEDITAMSGYLGTRAAPVFDVAFLMEIALIAVVLVGFSIARNRRYFRHGQIMAVALVLHLGTILLIMIPSMVTNYALLLTSGVGSIEIIAHAALGSITAVLAVILVLTWVTKPLSELACRRRKQLMKPTLILWLLSLALGIAFYLAYYVL